MSYVWVVWSQPIVGLDWRQARIIGAYDNARAANRVARDLPYGNVRRMDVLTSHRAWPQA